MKVLLLGNGFDLYYGLPTTYANFLHTVDFVCKYYNPKMQTVGDIFSDRWLTDIDGGIQRCYVRNYLGFNSTPIDPEDINEMREKASHNKWFAFFLQNHSQDVGWIDFEKEISKVLQEISGFFSLEMSSALRTSKAMTSYSNQYPFLVKLMKSFGLNGAFCGNSNGYPHYVLRDDLYYEDPPETRQFFLNKVKIAEELYLSLVEFSQILSAYLHLFIEEPVQYMVSHGLMNISPVFEDVSHVLTFNYTDTYEKLNTGTSVCHIHGLVNDRIVLGVNADEKDEIGNIDTTFIQFKKYFQRVFLHTEEQYLEFLHEYNRMYYDCDEDTSLIIMGHSLDVTDKDLIEALLRYAQNIQIYYHNDSAFQQYIRNLISIFGKEQFDEMRYSKGLTFIPLY